jgi:raffinose/stachyose/melibiose transport system permease protein
MARKKLKWSDMRPSEKRDHVIYLIGQILKWLFVGSMCIFTLYPVVYTLLGSFKTNAELTLGGNFLPENWQFNNYVYAFQKLDFGKYFLNSVVLALLTVVFTLITSSMAIVKGGSAKPNAAGVKNPVP